MHFAQALLANLLLVLSISQPSHAALGQKLAVGTYNGPGINVTVRKASIHVELGCAHGDFSRTALNAADKFVSDGYMQTDLVMINKPQIPSQLKGAIRDGKILIEIDEQSGGKFRFELTKGPLEPLMKCK